MTSKLLVVTVCLALFAIAEAHGDRKGFKRYIAYKRNINFFTAWQTCRLMGGHLASIESADENARVVDAIKAVGNINKDWFIGGTDIGIEGRFVWIGTNKEITSSTYRNWNNGEPNNSGGNEDCTAMGTKWNDIGCYSDVEGFVMNTGWIVLAIVAIAASTLPTTLALRYTVHTTKVSFYEAWTQCISNGGRLAAPETAQQNDAIWNAIKKAGASGSHWLAGTDNGFEGSWIWITSGVPVGIVNGYQNWDLGEPNNALNGENCLILGYNGTPMWYDAGCDVLYNYTMALKVWFLTLCLALFAFEVNGYKRYVAYNHVSSNFFAAWQTCRQYGGHLASIESAAENARVEAAIKAVGSISSTWLIGGTDIGIEGRFVWIGLNKEITSTAYKNWGTGKPSTSGNTDCMTMGGTTGYKTYVAYKRTVEWFTAWQMCRLYGGYLAAIETAEENALAAQAIRDAGSLAKQWFIGATDIGIEGRFVWIGLHKELKYTNWATGEPNNGVKEDCMAMGGATARSKWSDVTCDLAVDGFVCAFNVQ
uniref:C-type lectin domain-containing protein n=1 Tax=Anopheles dirus TaxID=7168 RepID=A0A182NPC9_9DIPT